MPVVVQYTQNKNKIYIRPVDGLIGLLFYDGHATLPDDMIL